MNDNNDYQERMRELKKACKRLFDTKDGKTVLQWLEKKYYYKSCFNENPQHMAYNEGRRDIVGVLKKYTEERI